MRLDGDDSLRGRDEHVGETTVARAGCVGRSGGTRERRFLQPRAEAANLAPTLAAELPAAVVGKTVLHAGYTAIRRTKVTRFRYDNDVAQSVEPIASPCKSQSKCLPLV